MNEEISWKFFEINWILTLSMSKLLQRKNRFQSFETERRNREIICTSLSPSHQLLEPLIVICPDKSVLLSDQNNILKDLRRKVIVWLFSAKLPCLGLIPAQIRSMNLQFCVQIKIVQSGIALWQEICCYMRGQRESAWLILLERFFSQEKQAKAWKSKI